MQVKSISTCQQLMIGIVLCRDKDRISVEYALKDINKPIGVSSYKLADYLPSEIIMELPTEIIIISFCNYKQFS